MLLFVFGSLRKVWKYKRDNQKPQVEEGQTHNDQKDKQRFTKHYTEK